MNTAKYTWNAYFDPITGYILAYNYVEQDVGSGYSFTWNDNLYVTSASYLAIASTSPSAQSTTITVSMPLQASLSTSETGGSSSNFIYALAVIIVAVFILIALSTIRRKEPEIPEHAQSYSSGPPVPDVSLVPPQPQQVVIRDVAKVKCKYCGCMVPTTVKTCPQCGGSPV